MLTATFMQPGKSTSVVMVVQGAAVSPVFARRRCRTEPASSHSERRSSSPLAPPPAKQVPGGFSMLTATCMQPGKSTAVVMVAQGAFAQFSPAAAAAPSPPLATASAVAQAHWHRRPHNKSSSSLVIGSCIGVPSGLELHQFRLRLDEKNAHTVWHKALLLLLLFFGRLDTSSGEIVGMHESRAILGGHKHRSMGRALSYLIPRTIPVG